MGACQDLPMLKLGLSEEEAQSRFDELQKKLVPLWSTISAITPDEQTIVVVPSVTIDLDIKGAEVQAYEERFLFMLLLLRQPRARIIYVTSQTILPATIEYYLSLLPGGVVGHARRRLFNVATEDRSSRPLTIKLLERPNLIRQIRSLIPDPDHAHLVTYNVTTLERDLALFVGIPIYGADPKFWPLGTKTGCRCLFAEEGVSHPIGREYVSTAGEIVDAIRELRQRKPALEEVMVKHNEGNSGEGNAVVTLRDLPPPGARGEEAAVRQRVDEMQLEHTGTTLDAYLATLAQGKGIVEERIVGKEIRSPSVQLRVTPHGEVELLSTHDQLLGGPSGQLYIGARFPADPAYANLICKEALKVGECLAEQGVLGRFAVDFVVVRRDDNTWEPYAIELNLRKGGTTHPFLTLQFLTDGRYDPETDLFLTPNGREKHFIASDHLQSPLFRVFTPDDLIDITIRDGLHFDHSRQTGIVFHMLASIAENGRIGATVVGDSQAEADDLYQRMQDVLKVEAEEALLPVEMPN